MTPTQAEWLVVMPDGAAPLTGRVLLSAGRLALVLTDDGAAPDTSGSPQVWLTPGEGDTPGLLARARAVLGEPLADEEIAVVHLAVSRAPGAPPQKMRPLDGVPWDFPGATPPDRPRL